MEWVDGLRCTDAAAFESEEAKQRFISIGVESGLKQVLKQLSQLSLACSSAQHARLRTRETPLQSRLCHHKSCQITCQPFA
eukprot:7993435-Pyramimonas_sp.AAC.1